MISVMITKNRKGLFERIECKGHALYDEYGKDIVCSAVSMLVINTINSIEVLAKCNIKVSEDADKGHISMKFDGINNEESCEKASLFIESLILGIKGVIDSYGKKYVTLEIQEV